MPDTGKVKHELQDPPSEPEESSKSAKRQKKEDDFPLKTPSAYVETRFATGDSLDNYDTLADDLTREHERVENKASDLYIWAEKKILDHKGKATPKLTPDEERKLVRRYMQRITDWRTRVRLYIQRCIEELEVMQESARVKELIGRYKAILAVYTARLKSSSSQFINERPLKSQAELVKDSLGGKKTLEGYKSLAAELERADKLINDEQSDLHTWKLLEIDAQLQKFGQEKADKMAHDITKWIQRWPERIIEHVERCIEDIKQKHEKSPAKFDEILGIFEELLESFSKRDRNPYEFINTRPLASTRDFVKDTLKGNKTLEGYKLLASELVKAHDKLTGANPELEEWRKKEIDAQSETFGKDVAQKVARAISQWIRTWPERIIKHIEPCIIDVKQMHEDNPVEESEKTICDLGNMVQRFSEKPKLQPEPEGVHGNSRFTYSNDFPLDPPATFVRNKLGKNPTLEKYISLAEELRCIHREFAEDSSKSRIHEWKKAEIKKEEEKNSDPKSKLLSDFKKSVAGKIIKWRRNIDIYLHQCEKDLTKLFGKRASSTIQDFAELRELFLDLESDQHEDYSEYLLNLLEKKLKNVEKNEHQTYGGRKHVAAMVCFVLEFERCERKLSKVFAATSASHARYYTKKWKTLEESYTKIIKERQELIEKKSRNTQHQGKEKGNEPQEVDWALVGEFLDVDDYVDYFDFDSYYD